MNVRSTQPFGRRGRAPRATSASTATPEVVGRLPQAKPLSPELVTKLLSAGAGEPGEVRQTEKVRRSLRAAVLAGLVVACLKAAVDASFATNAAPSVLESLFGSANMPVVAGLLLAALWSGAETSAACLLVAHRVLAALGRTSHVSYVIGGGAAALLLALITQAFGGTTSGSEALALPSLFGMTAGFFYRLLAGIEQSRGEDPGPTLFRKGRRAIERGGKAFE